MKFTLVFEDNYEGKGSSYDLLFAPCPIWSQGDNWILNLNPENPMLQAGSVNRLLEKEQLKHVNKCFIIVHHVGHGSLGCLELLKKDLENLDIKYKVLDFEELK